CPAPAASGDRVRGMDLYASTSCFASLSPPKIYVSRHIFSFSRCGIFAQGARLDFLRRMGQSVTDDSAARSARGVYGISVAAELSGLGPQTLRHYESLGLLTPTRTEGGTRRYSDDDLERLQRISELVELGVNLAGI